MQLILTLKKDGSLDVTGPIDNKVIAYGLLEAGKMAIAEHHRRLAERAIVPGTAQQAAALRNLAGK